MFVEIRVPRSSLCESDKVLINTDTIIKVREYLSICKIFTTDAVYECVDTYAGICAKLGVKKYAVKR